MQKRLLLVNCVCGVRSTGRICSEIAHTYEDSGWIVRIAYGRLNEITEESKRWAVKIGNRWSLYFHVLMTRLFDRHGTGVCSRLATKKFIRWAEEYKPDVLWLHNFHGYFLNYEVLFSWIKSQPDMEVKWTLHDCWPFTGHCSHFLSTGCSQWMNGCKEKCPEKMEFPRAFFFSAAKSNWESKRRAFCGVKRMTLITPSNWLSELTRKSFLKEYPIKVVHNKINESVFVPTPSNFRDRYGLLGKTIVLGVSSSWDDRKGLCDFLRLRDILDDNYVIVLVGLKDRQIRHLPKGILGLGCTNSPHRLAEIYTAADWFFNPTREDNYPSVNVEARHCGCKIVTYDTGGARETIEGYDRGLVLAGSDKSADCFAAVIMKGL